MLITMVLVLLIIVIKNDGKINSDILDNMNNNDSNLLKTIFK